MLKNFRTIPCPKIAHSRETAVRFSSPWIVTSVVMLEVCLCHKKTLPETEDNRRTRGNVAIDTVTVKCLMHRTLKTLGSDRQNCDFVFKATESL